MHPAHSISQITSLFRFDASGIRNLLLLMEGDRKHLSDNSATLLTEALAEQAAFALDVKSYAVCRCFTKETSQA